MKSNGDEAKAAELESKLATIDRSIEDADYRAANTRADYVYVISDIGAFGEGVVKIGMTRRLDPMDRIRELSSASVPFQFDVHALFFSEDAVGLETALHHDFEARRVNRVNARKEFFRATPQEVLDRLRERNVAVVEFKVEPDAEEYRGHARDGGRRPRRLTDTHPFASRKSGCDRFMHVMVRAVFACLRNAGFRMIMRMHRHGLFDACACLPAA